MYDPDPAALAQALPRTSDEDLRYIRAVISVIVDMNPGMLPIHLYRKLTAYLKGVGQQFQEAGDQVMVERIATLLHEVIHGPNIKTFLKNLPSADNPPKAQWLRGPAPVRRRNTWSAGSTETTSATHIADQSQSPSASHGSAIAH